jgi:hypothetical protein
MRPVEQLVIEQTDSSVTIGPPDLRGLTLYFDGRDVVVRDSADAAHSVSGRWTRARFEVRRTLEDRRVLTEAYVLSSNGQRLVVLVQLSGGEEGQTTRPEIRRVYDRIAK